MGFGGAKIRKGQEGVTVLQARITTKDYQQISTARIIHGSRPLREPCPTAGGQAVETV